MSNKVFCKNCKWVGEPDGLCIFCQHPVSKIVTENPVTGEMETKRELCEFMNSLLDCKYYEDKFELSHDKTEDGMDKKIFLKKGDQVFADGVYLVYTGNGTFKLSELSLDCGMWLDGEIVIYTADSEPFIEIEEN